MSQTSIDSLEHSRKCLEDITSLLVTAGYYKAGDMKEGEEFDKVVGGLAWVITATLTTTLNVSLPTLLNASSISTRISLSEVLHDTLLKMELPIEISPHQIQGVDAPALLPVVRWAIKNFQEKRGATGRKILGFGGGVEFRKHDYDKGVAGLLDEEEVAKHVDEMQELFKVSGRKYRFKGSDGGTEEQRVHKCLLEYGEKMRSYRGLRGGESGGEPLTNNRGPGRTKQSAFDKQLADAQKIAEEEEKALEEARERMATQLMKNCEELGIGTSNDENVAARGGVGGLVTLGRGEIGIANEEYEKLREKMLEERRARDENKDIFNRRREGLEKEIESSKKLLTGSNGKREKGKKALDEINKMTEEIHGNKNKNVMIRGELDKLLEQEEASDQKDALKKLWALVQKNEKIKKEEKDFKDNCKKKLEALSAALKSLDEANSDTDEEEARAREIDEMYAKISSKHGKVRELLAQRNLQVASTSRKIDDVPTRTELIQYERRFVELYQQVALKLEETRKYYSTYNTLDSTRNFLAKEVKLIDSITNSFDAAMKSKASQDEFLQQFEAIIKGVQDSLKKQQNLKKKKSEEVTNKEAEYMNVVDEQRRYFKAVKDFQDECQRNEVLVTKAEELGVVP